MAPTRPPPDLDPRDAQRAREWFAEARARTALEDAETAAKPRRSSPDDSGGGFWDWLHGDGDGDGDFGDGSGGD